ncbi:MAG: hypothetical protein V7K88_21280 [Nostoc sp.]
MDVITKAVMTGLAAQARSSLSLDTIQATFVVSYSLGGLSNGNRYNSRNL